MAATVPPAPPFGAPCPIEPSPATMALLAQRRSSSAATLAPPGPSDSELRDLLRLGTRVPDHGKLTPWRFVIWQGEAKARLVQDLHRLAAQDPNPAKAGAALGKLSAPPVSLLVISAPKPGKQPEWEQELSAGAVCTTLLIAAQAMGYGANWITDWYSVDPRATALMGVQAGEQIAGFIHLGTPPDPPLERVRPNLDELVSWA